MLSSAAAARGWTLPRKPGKNPAKLAFWGMGRLRIWLLSGLALAAGLGGCGSAPPSADALAANDPWEQTNRETLKLNGKIDRYFVIPTVGLYFLVVPEAGRRGVHNFLGNLSLPTIFVSDMLQGEFSRAGK